VHRPGLTLRTLLLSGVLAALALGLGAPAALAQESSESVRGVLRFERDPVEGVRISVAAEDGSPLGESVSDAEGRWEVPVPEPGVYVVTIDVTTLPEGIDQVAAETVTTEVGNTQRKAVIFRLGVPGDGTGDGGGGSSGTGITLDRVLQLTAEGLRFGVILALAALGLSMIFGTTGLTNFSHGELITFGAIVTLWLNAGQLPFLPSVSIPALPFVLAAFVAVLLSGGFGWLQDKVLWRPLRRRKTGLIAMMIISIGLAVFLRFFYLYRFGGSRQSYREYTIQTGIEIGPVTLAPRDLVSVAVAVIALAAVVWALSATRTGKATRAVSDNPPLASASGIDVNHVIRVVWIGGAGLAGLAGVLIGLSQQVDYQMGFKTLLLVFAAVILGGLGTIWGAIFGAIVVGLFIQLSTLVLPIELQEAGVLAVLIIVLLVRPQGLLGRRERVG
jgi:branched-subunit amino acid ABC-type transport system permease component